MGSRQPSTRNMKPTIITGGQTGVDRAALDFARENTIPCGGWCPKGRKAEDGVIPGKYALKETVSDKYSQRTTMNVKDSDGTLIILNNYPDEGTLLTVIIAQNQSKPIFVQDASKRIRKQEFQKWLKNNKIKTLNIAGPRESNSPGIYEETLKLLRELLV